MLRENPEYQDAFSKLSESDLSQNEIERIFSVLYYNIPQCNNINDTMIPDITLYQNVPSTKS